MAPRSKTCPGCETAMKPVLAKDVELDCCPKCGGLWFDFGALTQVTRREAAPELIGGHTSRRCAFCRISLEPALLPGAIPVETCTACRGIYLDAEELEEFAGRPISLTSRDGLPWKHARPEQGRASGAAVPSSQSFVCVKCGWSFPLREGHALRDGLACQFCTPQPQTSAAEKRDAHASGGLFSGAGGGEGFDFDFGGGDGGDGDFFPD
ncbi:hypothetical protein F0U61_52780 [Archangium violaceum]|uniref:TFIIB-type zinc ribbon-containing protein n=1 Tax=Archangium violaceum TaxID=83451 RepID=UPI002B29CA02|nr:hypothetical protein F0U61_52780 [Archangium violaceum]